MTYIQKCEWLKLYQTSLRRQELLVRRIRDVQDRSESVTQALSPVVVSGGTGDKIGRSVEALDAFRRELDREVLHGQQLCSEIRNAIWSVRDPLLQDVLEMCYIDGLHRWQIANRLHASERHVHRLHLKAVGLLDIPEDVPTL